jgi:hypothetical protein
MSGEGEWLYRCSTCDQYMTSDHFHQDNSKPPFNVAYICKVCRKDRTTTPTNLADWEIEKADALLVRIGLDPSDDNIHQQFISLVKDKYGVDIT